MSGQVLLQRGTVRGHERLNTVDNLLLSFYWFSINFHWGALLTVLLQTHILSFVPDAQKAAYLGLLFSSGAAIALVTQPIMGAISDRSSFRWGRRRPFLVAGVVLNSAALVAMANAPSFTWLLILFLFVQFSNNVAGAAYNGFIPDIVPDGQRGTASGFMGLMTMLGTMSAYALAPFVIRPGDVGLFYYLIAGVLVVGMLVTIWSIREVPAPKAAPFNLREFFRNFWLDPRQYPDFAWVFLTRALVMLAFYTLLSFIEYYLKDVIGFSLEEVVARTALVGGAVLVGATISTLASGILSDRIGRKPIVFTAGMLMGLTAAVFVLTSSFTWVLVFAAIFGLGYGAYTSVDWALAVDVLPSKQSAAKDLGIWSVAITLPQTIAPGLGGLIITLFSSTDPTLGYRAVFVLAFVYAVLGSVFVWRIRGTR